jgi:hypothetical protein
LTFTFKQSTTTRILPVTESDNIRSLPPDSGHLLQNPANPDSNETVRIPASGNNSQNPVKVAEILPVNDGISSPMIFILFYINIYML